MALIVKIAQDKELLRVFESIANNPRHILLRYRQNTRLSRIQEIDSACIRDIAKRPGRTIYEKAGPRQELLAVQRLESKDTLENRVFVWVLSGMLERSWGYIATNSHHIDSTRVKEVSKCNKQSAEWANVESLKEISYKHLQHPVQPNYTLQMDSRYIKVYKIYKLLLKEQQVIDDSWEWQRNLWAESARQLMSCSLTTFYSEESISTPYYKHEGEYGLWAESPVVPGPLKTKGGNCFVIDSRDVMVNLSAWVEKPPFKFSPYLGSLGCDQVLFWPESNTLLIVWFIYCTERSGKLADKLKSPGLALRNFSADLNRYARMNYNCFGVILFAENQKISDGQNASLGVEIDTWPSEGENEMVGLRIPFDIAQTNPIEFEGIIEDLKVGIQLAIDMTL